MLLEIKNLIFRTNFATCEENVKEQNSSFQRDLQILFCPFFDKIHSFCYNRDKYYKKSKIQFSRQTLWGVKKCYK